MASKKYVMLDAEGAAIGFLADDINTIPNEALRISDKEWNDWIKEPSRYRHWGNGIVKLDAPTPKRYVPAQVTNLQASAVMMSMPSKTGSGTFYDDVDRYARTVGGIVLMAWTKGSFVRASLLINTLAKQFDLTDAEVDELFIAAEKVAL